MTPLYDAGRARVSLGRELKVGGEGTVYLVEGRPALVAKVHHRGATPAEAKLAWMKDHPPTDPTRALKHVSIAWPRDLLYNGRGAFVGFLMPRVDNAAPLFDVFNPTRRARVLPGFNGLYLHRTARNLASAVGALHARDYVVGDLNEGNILVTPTALVALIDTDSFQVRAHQGARATVYPCPVGKAEYTPPELQGQPFGHLIREPEHDRFALGVLIFQLLMEGNHPFRARWLGDGDPPSLEAKIKRGSFPHQKPPPSSVAPPMNAPALETLHPGVAYLIRCCFADGHRRPARRPSPADWEGALAAAERALTTCANGHFFSSHLRACPRCGIRLAATRVLRPATRRETSDQRESPRAARTAILAVPPPTTAQSFNRGVGASVRQHLVRLASFTVLVAVMVGFVTGDLSNLVQEFRSPSTGGRLAATLPTREAAGRAPAEDADVTSGCWTWPQRRSDELAVGRWWVPPATVIDVTRRYTATLETSEGTIGIELLPEGAPAAVNNFVCLARAGFYDGTRFHRIVADYLVQGGDPTGSGTGGPGYAIPDEAPARDYLRGTVAMVSQGPDTSGSQFFIILADLRDELPPHYTVFGQVRRGQAVLDRIAAVPTARAPDGEQSVPLTPVILERVTVATR